MFKQISCWYQSLLSVFGEEKEFIEGHLRLFATRELYIYIAIVIILNLYSLSNFSLSIDDEMQSYTPPCESWLSMGRWTAALINRFLFPQPVIPYVPSLFFSICLSISYMFLIWSHNYTPKGLGKYLALSVFVTFPVWQFIAGFDGILPAISVGLVLVTFSNVLFVRSRNTWKDKKYANYIIVTFFQIMLVSMSIGAYQSFLLLHLATSFGIILVGVLKGDDSFQAILQGTAQTLAVGLCGFAISSAIGRIVQRIMGITPSSYLGSFMSLEAISLEPLGYLRAFFREMYAYYSGDANKFGAAFAASGLIVLLAFLSTFLRLRNKNLLRKLLASSLLFTVAISPFLFKAVALSVPTRSLYPLSYVMWLMASTLLTEERKPLFAVHIVAILLFVLQALNINGLYNGRLHMAQQYDRLIAADLYNRLGSAGRNFDRNTPIFIDVYGTINFSTRPYPLPWSGTMGASFFDWGGGNLGRMVTYMRLVGYSNVNRLPADQRVSLSHYYEDMPAWPAPGCVREVDENIYLIKLSETPDTFHARNAPTP